MVDKFLQIEVKPPIDVAALATGNFTDGFVLFDWIGFDVPRGAIKIMSITTLYKGKNGAYYAPGDFEVLFAKGNIDGTAPTTLGDDGAVVDTPGWWGNIQGKSYIDSSAGSNADMIYGSIISSNASGGDVNSENTQGLANTLVLQGVPGSGSSVAYDKLYMAGVSQGAVAHNWGVSTMQVSTETATNTPVVIVKTLGTLISLSPGDILRDQAGQLLGTIKTVDSDTQVTLEADCASVSAVNQLVYNTTPLTFILSFEK